MPHLLMKMTADEPYQHIWQWHGTFEDCQSVRPWVWDQFSISIVLPVLSHGPVCTVIVSLLDILGVVFHICIHWPLIGFRLAIRGLGRIEGPRKASNWGELERAPHRRVGLGFCHSRYIYIGIGGPTAIFEPAPFLQPCTFFWPDLVDRKLHTEPRITRIPMHNTRLRSRAYCAHTNARPAYLRTAKST